MPDWTKEVKIENKTGNWIVNNDCWMICCSGTYNKVYHVGIKVNDKEVAIGTNWDTSWYSYSNNCIPLTVNDKITISNSYYGDAYQPWFTLYPCKYVTEHLELTPATIGLNNENPLEKLLIKDYYPLTDEQIKELEREKSTNKVE